MAKQSRDPMEIAEDLIEEARRTGATELVLSGLKLTSLPESLAKLTQLTWLALDHNQLTSLPEFLGQLTQLTELDADNNQLPSVPQSITRLTNLTWLDLSSNRLAELPNSLGQLTQLTNLDLTSNQLTALPDSIGQLASLEQLYLDHNQLTALPDSIGQLASLEELHLYHNLLQRLPDAIGGLCQLRQLEVRGNRLTDLPESLGQLTRLRSLMLNDNQLTALPESIGQLTALVSLEAGDNQLARLPESLGDLHRLELLYLRGNRLVSLPDSIGKLGGLKTLYVNVNQLHELPRSIRRLTALTQLDLSGNPLGELPESVCQLRQLKALALIGCQLKSLPLSLGQLQQLRALYLHQNDALNIPNEILGPTLEQENGKPTSDAPTRIHTYLTRTGQGTRPLNEAKIILLGRGEVGKTSLVNRLVHDSFNPGESITHGINITRWRISLGDDPVTLHLWDFGGQEIMHATHQFFLSERSLYLVVLNGRQGQEDAEADYWLQLIRSFGGDSPILVVLNKVGQHPFDVNRNDLQRRYPNIRGFVKTDCASRVGIDELRLHLETELDRLPSLRANFPAVWFTIKDRLTQMEENYLDFDAYSRICSDLGEKDETAQEQLAGFLHALGIALHFRDDPRLNDRHILNPHWVTGGIYALINAPQLAVQNGLLDPKDLRTILDPKTYPRAMHRFLLDLMRKFDVCFGLPDESGRYLIPELLGKQEPAETRRFLPEQCLNFEYRYAVLPEGLVPRFVARTHWHSTNRPRWRTGVILAFDGSEALVVTDPATRRVIVRVLGPADRRRSLLALVRSEFDRIHADFTGNPPEPWVPLPGHPDVAVRYRDLLVREEKGRPTIEQVLGEDVHEFNVAELLNGVDLPGTRRHDERRSRDRVKLFVSYAHKDETHKATLGGHLLPLVQEGLIHWWDDRHLRPGDDWAGAIDHNLDQADVILLLVSRHFLASRYCRDLEVPRALARQTAGEVLVVPVILDGSDTNGQPFMGRQVLPTDNRPILDAQHWPDPNDAWRQVTSSLREVVREHVKHR